MKQMEADPETPNELELVIAKQRRKYLKSMQSDQARLQQTFAERQKMQSHRVDRMIHHESLTTSSLFVTGYT